VARLAIKVAIRAAQLQGRMIDRCVWNCVPGAKMMVLTIEYTAIMSPSILKHYSATVKNLPSGNYYYGPIRSYQIGLGISTCMPYIGVHGCPRKLDYVDSVYVDNLTFHDRVSRWVYQPIKVHTWVFGPAVVDPWETLIWFVKQTPALESDRQQILDLLEPVSALVRPAEIVSRVGRMKVGGTSGYDGAMDVSGPDRMKILVRKRKPGGGIYAMVETLKPSRTKHMYVVIDINDMPPAIHNNVAEERGVLLRVGSPDPTLCVKTHYIPMSNRWYPVGSPHCVGNPYSKHLVVKVDRGTVPVPAVNSKTAYVVYVMLLGVGSEYYVGSFTAMGHRQESRALVADYFPPVVRRTDDSDTEEVCYDTQGGEDIDPELDSCSAESSLGANLIDAVVESRVGSSSSESVHTLAAGQLGYSHEVMSARDSTSLPYMCYMH